MAIDCGRAGVLGACLWLGVGVWFGEGEARGQCALPRVIRPPQNAPAQYFGQSVAISGDLMVVGAPGEDDPIGGGIDDGAAYVYRWDGSKWAHEVKLRPLVRQSSALFGYSVAVDGDTVVIGAKNESDTFPGQGAVYVYFRSGTTWWYGQRLVASNPEGGDNFGAAVAVEGDTILVGAPFSGAPFRGAPFSRTADSGHAYIYTRSDGVWSQQAILSAADEQPFDLLGTTVALDGGTAYVTAPYAASAFGADAGAVYAFDGAESSWAQSAKITAAENTSGDAFGEERCLAVEGDDLVVGAPYDSSQGTGSGSAFVFHRTGGSWTQAAKLISPAVPTGSFANFGAAVGLSSGTLVIGEPQANLFGLGGGALRIFERSGVNWLPVTSVGMIRTIVPATDYFGAAVAIDGPFAAGGGPLDDPSGGADNDRGAVESLRKLSGRWRELPNYPLWVPTSAAPSAFDFASSTGAIQDSTVPGSVRPISYSALSQSMSAGTPVFDPQDPMANWFGNALDVNGVLMFVAETATGRLWRFGRPNPTSLAWTQQGLMPGSDGAFPVDAVAADGNLVVAGCTSVLHEGFGYTGSAVTYAFNGSVWSGPFEVPMPSPGNPPPSYNVGFRVALSGNTIAVSAMDFFYAYPNRLHMFTVAPSGTATFEQTIELGSGGFFGQVIRLRGDMMVVAYPGFDGPGGVDTGRLRIYRRSAGIWSLDQTIDPPGPAEPGELFGQDVRVDGDTMLVTASGVIHPTDAEQGQSYLYTEIGDEWIYRGRVSLPADVFGSMRTTAGLGDGVVIALTSQGLAAIPLDAECSSATTNLGRGEGYPDVPGAISDADPGDTLLAGADAIEQTPVIDFGGKPLDIESTGDVVRLSGSSTTIPEGGTLAAAPNSDLDFDGALNVQDGGSLLRLGTTEATLSGESFELGSTGSLAVGAGASLAIESPVCVLRGSASVGSGGVLRLAGDSSASGPLSLGAGSTLRTSGSIAFTHHSNTTVSLRQGIVLFEGSSSPRTLEAMSRDIGAVAAGLDPLPAGHYPIGTLHISPGAGPVELIDALDNDGPGQAVAEAVYAETLIIDSGATLKNSTVRIYARTITLNGQVTNPSNLIPIVCAGNANGDGVVSFADVTAVLANFGVNYGGGTGAGDANGDHVVSFADITSVLANFGAVCP